MQTGDSGVISWGVIGKRGLGGREDFSVRSVDRKGKGGIGKLRLCPLDLSGVICFIALAGIVVLARPVLCLMRPKRLV